MSLKKLDELLNNTPVISYNSKDMETASNEERKQEMEAVMWESDKNDPNRVKYRINSLEQSFDSIRSVILGYSKSFRDYVRDDNGKLSEKKIRDFIGNMIETYPRKDELSQEKRHFIELFLYCAVVGPSSNTRYEAVDFGYCVEISDSFSDLIRAAKDPGLYITDPVRFASEEEQDSLLPEYAHGFLSSLNMVWDILYEKTPKDYYTPEQKEAASVIYEDMTGCDYETGRSLYETEAEEPPLSDNGNAGSRIRIAVDETDTEDDNRSENDDGIEELYEFPEPDYEMLEAEEQAKNEFYEKKWLEYADTLPSDHRLGDVYKEFRDMLFVTEHSDLAQIITEMTESFLIAEDLSPVCMGNEYGIIAVTLEKSVNAISKKVAAAENLSKKGNNI